MRSRGGGERRCPCGLRYLREDFSATRIRHDVPCFLFGHEYSRVCARDGHVEYACAACGHPLLFELERSAYSRLGGFRKKVRYRCNLFGHRVHEVVERAPFTEYACHCGHSFLKRQKTGATIRHPPICLAAGHFVSFVARRAGYAEHVCRNCGHTFYFT